MPLIKILGNPSRVSRYIPPKAQLGFFYCQNMSKVIELAKKLKALAENGVGGEKINAQKMLESFMKKHHITSEDIESDSILEYYFKIAPAYGALFVQISKRKNINIKTYGEFPQKTIKEYKLKGNYMLECTKEEYVYISTAFDILKRQYEKELEIFYYAFCRSNDLLVDRRNNDVEPTKEEIAKARRAKAMSELIEKAKINKQLNQTGL